MSMLVIIQSIQNADLADITQLNPEKFFHSKRLTDERWILLYHLSLMIKKQTMILPEPP